MEPGSVVGALPGDAGSPPAPPKMRRVLDRRCGGGNEDRPRAATGLAAGDGAGLVTDGVADGRGRPEGNGSGAPARGGGMELRRRDGGGGNPAAGARSVAARFDAPARPSASAAARMRSASSAVSVEASTMVFASSAVWSGDRDPTIVSDGRGRTFATGSGESSSSTSGALARRS